MLDFKILFIYPNIRKRGQVPPNITLFSRILKNNGFITDVFDSTGYEIPDIGIGYSEEKRQEFMTEKKADREMSYDDRVDIIGDLNKKIKEFNPNLIAVTTTESTFLIAEFLLKNIDEKHAPVILGGVFATSAPEVVIKFKEVDMLCVGEGEEMLLDLCSRMRDGLDYKNIQGLWIKDNGKVIKNPLGSPVRIDNNPTDYDVGIFDERRHYRPMDGREGAKLYKLFSVETERGCPYQCTYCNSPSLHKIYKNQTGESFFRRKSMEKVREEILHYRDNFGAEYIFFWADTFLAMPKKEFNIFCEMYSEIKLPFWIQTRPETMDHKIFVKLKDIGLDRVAIGIEQGNEEFRRKVLGKKCSNEKYIYAAKILHDLDIPFHTFNMIGMPYETPELVLDTIELNRQMNPDDAGCSVFSPFYGTPLRDLCVKEGFMKDDIVCAGQYEDSPLDMPQFSSRLIGIMQQTFVMRVRFPKNRWCEIDEAEERLLLGDNSKWQVLREEFNDFTACTPH
jgi:radical SAM superfamily enzyme YgiQ (UPF0313 family)|tara:strand:+ start:8421 stop:9941 length:1521 start_codon:yes stop_codon:yes gene_type:complete